MWLFYFILYASNARRVVTTIKMAHYMTDQAFMHVYKQLWSTNK